MIAFALTNWKWLALGVAALVAIGWIGLLKLELAHRDTRIAELHSDIDGMKAQQADNIARAEKAVRERLQAEIDVNKQIIEGLNAEKAALQEKANAAEVSLAAIPVAPTPTGCPDPMSLPVVGAFLHGVPER